MNQRRSCIFVSIASYRDPQLNPTISDCLAKADHPERLRFGICQQRGPEEPLTAFAENPRFRVLDVPWQQSRGACWARAQIMNLWREEEYYLQLDSHCRLGHGWDSELTQMLEATESLKPVLSTYACSFNPDRDEVLSGHPLQIGFRDFSSEGIPCFRPASIANWKLRSKPVRARFLSAGFLFARGSFVEEIPYDPDLYFLGEETNLTIRAFTSGYDFFHPHKSIVWHQYKRLESPKHWSDHVRSNGIDSEWRALDKASKSKLQQLISSKESGRYSLGTARTLESYESYAGIDFTRRRAQPYTHRGLEPPNPAMAPDWSSRIHTWKVDLDVDTSLFPLASYEDAAFWYVGFHDAQNREIYRKDIPSGEFGPEVHERNTITISRTFDSDVPPCTWTLWPKSRKEGWLKRVSGMLDSVSCKIVD